jgi:hypothetical protein
LEQSKAKQQDKKKSNDSPKHQKPYQIEPMRTNDINRIVAYRGDYVAVAKHPPREDI